MKFFFDNRISHKFVAALKALGRDGLVHLTDEFDPNTKDVVWMPAVAARGWFAVTYDLRIRTRPEERALREKPKLSTMFFAGSFQDLVFDEQSWRFVHVNGKIVAFK